MHAEDRIDAALERAIGGAGGPACPPGLAEAMHYAVFPGGHRIRPQLCLAVAVAQAGSDDAVVDAALSSIELLHCASLVHDDMPCFDDAPTVLDRSNEQDHVDSRPCQGVSGWSISVHGLDEVRWVPVLR